MAMRGRGNSSFFPPCIKLTHAFIPIAGDCPPDDRLVRSRPRRASAGLSFPIRRIVSRERCNRRERVFFGDDDCGLYRDFLHEACRREGVAVRSYCLTPNHGQLILTPQAPEGLRVTVT